MSREHASGKPTTPRYSPGEEASAVRMVRTLRAGSGSEHGTVPRIASQLGNGVETVRTGVTQADVDGGHVAGMSMAEARRVWELEQGNRGVRRANGILN